MFLNTTTGNIFGCIHGLAVVAVLPERMPFTWGGDPLLRRQASVADAGGGRGLDQAARGTTWPPGTSSR